MQRWHVCRKAAQPLLPKPRRVWPSGGASRLGPAHTQQAAPSRDVPSRRRHKMRAWQRAHACLPGLRIAATAAAWLPACSVPVGTAQFQYAESISGLPSSSLARSIAIMHWQPCVFGVGGWAGGWGTERSEGVCGEGQNDTRVGDRTKGGATPGKGQQGLLNALATCWQPTLRGGATQDVDHKPSRHPPTARPNPTRSAHPTPLQPPLPTNQLVNMQFRDFGAFTHRRHVVVRHCLVIRHALPSVNQLQILPLLRQARGGSRYEEQACEEA